MSLICDICKKKLEKNSNAVFFPKAERHICGDCVKTCKEIISDNTTSKVTFLNEYRELQERRKVR